MTQAEITLASVTEAASKRVNYFALFLGFKAFVQTLAGAAAFSDMVGTQTTGLILISVSALDTGISAYMLNANRKQAGSATNG